PILLCCPLAPRIATSRRSRNRSVPASTGREPPFYGSGTVGVHPAVDQAVADEERARMALKVSARGGIDPFIALDVLQRAHARASMFFTSRSANRRVDLRPR